MAKAAARDFVWVNKNLQSQYLSRSGGSEKRDILAHVQFMTRYRFHPRVRRNSSERRDRKRSPASQKSFLPYEAFPDETALEQRSIQYYCERTAVECSGWCDAQFWSGLCLQISTTQPAVRHSIVALSAIHESLSVDDRAHAQFCYSYSLQQCNKAIGLINSGELPGFVVLTACVILISFQMMQDVRSLWIDPDYTNLALSINALRSGLALLEAATNVNADSPPSPETSSLSLEIRPLLERYKFQLCAMNDVSGILHLIPLYEFEATPPEIPDKFSTPFEARDFLEHLLSWTGYLYKTRKPDSTAELPGPVKIYSERWSSALDALSKSTSTERRTIILLRAARIASLVMIQTMSAPDECAYDVHVPAFASIIDLYSEIFPPSSMHLHFEFPTGSGVIDTLRMIARRCRDPTIRRQACDLLSCCCRNEGLFSAGVTGALNRKIIEIEEAGLDNPQSCTDIPERNRIRVLTTSFFLGDQRRMRIQYVRHPYDTAKCSIEEFNMGGTDEDDEKKGTRREPDAVFGHNYVRFLRPGSTSEYHVLDGAKAFFPIPKM